MLAVNNYEEFLKMVDVIAQSYSPFASDAQEAPSIVVLVGPSGSGKSKIATRLLSRTDRYEKLISYTTKDPTAVEENQWYSYVPREQFRQLRDSGEMFQSTMYLGQYYGSKKEDVERILAEGKRVLSTMDICGAMALKTYYKDVKTIYIKRVLPCPHASSRRTHRGGVKSTANTTGARSA